MIRQISRPIAIGLLITLLAATGWQFDFSRQQPTIIALIVIILGVTWTCVPIRGVLPSALLSDVPGSMIRAGTWLIGVSVPSIWLLTLWDAFPAVLDYSDSAGPALWQTGDLVAVPGSIHALVYPHIASSLPAVLAWADTALGINVTDGHLVLAAFAFALALTSLAVLALYLSGSPLALALALSVGAGSWFGALHVGYGLFFFSPGFLLGSWGLVFSVAAWAVWMVRADSIAWRLPCFMLAGVVFNLHATYGLLLGVIFGLGELIALIQNRSVAKAWLVPLAAAGSFAVAALPEIISIIELLTSPLIAFRSPDDTASWWSLMAFRKPSHIFLWDHGGIQGDVAILGAIASLAILNLAFFVRRTLILRMGITLIAISLFLLLSYVGSAWLRSPTLSGLVLSRAALLAMIAVFAMIAALPIAAFRGWQRTGDPLDACRVMALSGAMFLCAQPLQGEEGLTPFLMIALLLVAAGAGWVSSSRWPRRSGSLSVLERLTTPVLVGCVVAVLTMLPAKWRSEAARMPKERSEAWRSVTDFLRDQTSKDKLILMPPYPYATATAQRSFPVDYGQFGWSVYARWLVDHEIAIAERIYGISLADRSSEEVQAYAREHGGILCLFERGYLDLVSSRKRLEELHDTWPAMAYVVAPKPGTIPDEWTCGPTANTVLDLPLAYENAAYLIYELPDDRS
ncbi:MAG: hypothetical protein ACR2P3_04535 [Geminicoccaceae bacterium]